MKPSVPARRSTGRGITKRNRGDFLHALEDGTTVRDACRLIDKHHRTLYELRKVDETFATAWDEAWEMGTQALEAEAHRRAVEGYVETTYGADGSVLRRVHRYSDALLQKLLAGRRPDVYGNQPSRVEVAGRLEVEPIRHKRGLTLADLINDPRAAGLIKNVRTAYAEVAAAEAPLALPPARDEDEL